METPDRLDELEEKLRTLSYDHGRELARLQAQVDQLMKQMERLDERVGKNSEDLGYSKGWQTTVGGNVQALRKTLDKLLLQRARGRRRTGEDAPTAPPPEAPPASG